MGNYTLYEDPLVDNQINHQLNTILGIVLDSAKESVESVILTGGFGRGEGSVIFDSEGQVVPLKDYDLVVVLKKDIGEKAKNQINEQINSQLGLSNHKKSLFRFSDFVVDLSFTTLDRLTLFPDIAIYELKVASYLLYGKDIRQQIPWKHADIPLANGCRLLFEKMTGLIGHFPNEYFLGETLDKRSARLLAYECYKVYVEIATSLSLMAGFYAPSYLQRKQLFEVNFESKLHELSNYLPELPDAVVAATDFKLKPNFRETMCNPLNTWFETRNALLAVAKFYLQVYLNVPKIDFLNSGGLLENGLKKNYFAHIAAGVSKKLLKTNLPFMINATNSAFQSYSNLQYLQSIHRDKQHVPLRFLLSPFTGVTLKLFSIAPQVLLSIQEDACINEEYFKVAKARLSSLSPHQNIGTFLDLLSAYLVAYKHLPIH